jgi:hypothetical protein
MENHLSTDDKYYLKYLKYKKKYIQLCKNINDQQGGLTFLDGEYTFFTSNELLKNLQIKFIANGDAPSVKDINEKLDAGGFRIKKGSKNLEFIMDLGTFDNLGKLSSKVGNLFKHYGKKSLATAGIGAAMPFFLLAMIVANVGTKHDLDEETKRPSETDKEHEQRLKRIYDAQLDTKVEKGIEKIFKSYGSYIKNENEKYKEQVKTYSEEKINELKKENMHGKIPNIIELGSEYDGSDELNQVILNIIKNLGSKENTYVINTALVIQINSARKNKFISKTDLILMPEEPILMAEEPILMAEEPIL